MKGHGCMGRIYGTLKFILTLRKVLPNNNLRLVKESKPKFLVTEGSRGRH